MDFPEDFGGIRGFKKRFKGQNKAKATYDKSEGIGNQAWYDANVKYLIGAMHRMWAGGQMPNGNFVAANFKEIAIQMQLNAPVQAPVPWTAQQLMTKARAIQKLWCQYHNLVTTQTGWGIDNDSGQIVAPEGAWQEYLEAHPKFAQEWDDKPIFCYEELTDMWAGKTVTGRYTHGGSSTNPFPVGEEADTPPEYGSAVGQSSGSQSSSKRSSRDWRDEDSTGVTRQKTNATTQIQRSLES